MYPTKYYWKTGFRQDTAYPTLVDMPERGNGPRCQVMHQDTGPLVRLFVLDVTDNGHEEHICSLPRCYAIPLTLMNKKMAFFESLRFPSGFPIRRGAGRYTLTKKDMLEYTYLWRLRQLFLEKLFEEQQIRRIEDDWRSDILHGYLHREYARYEHTSTGRQMYWKSQTQSGTPAYELPDIQDMDWTAYLTADRQRRGRSSFLWRHISQGYEDDSQDQPQTWLAWLEGDLRLARDALLSFEKTPRCKVGSLPGSQTKTASAACARRIGQLCKRKRDGAGETKGTVDHPIQRGIAAKTACTGPPTKSDLSTSPRSATQTRPGPAQDVPEETSPRKRRKLTFVITVDADLEIEWKVAPINTSNIAGASYP